MKALLITLTFLISFTQLGIAQPFAHEDIYQVVIRATTKQQRSIVANYIHIDEIYPDKVVAYVNGSDLEKLQKSIPNTRLMVAGRYSWKKINQTRGPVRSNLDEYQFPTGDEAFHTYEEVNSKLMAYAASSEFVELIDIGRSHEGRRLLGVKITTGGFGDELKKPAMMLIGTHHAREHLSTEVSLMMGGEILKQIKTDESFKNFMRDRVVYLVPLLNPDGALHDIKGSRYKYWRKNRRDNEGSSYMGVDLNRNYSYGWGTGGSSNWPSSDVYMGPSPFSEPETQAVKKFVEDHKNIKTMISFHTFSKLILYPWGGKYDGVGGKEEEVFVKMAETMAKWNGYTPQQSSELYIASGDTCDWAYGEHNIFCFTFELNPGPNSGRRGFYPGAGMIPTAFKLNIKPVLYLLKNTEDPYAVLK